MRPILLTRSDWCIQSVPKILRIKNNLPGILLGVKMMALGPWYVHKVQKFILDYYILSYCHIYLQKHGLFSQISMKNLEVEMFWGPKIINIPHAHFFFYSIPFTYTI